MRNAAAAAVDAGLADAAASDASLSGAGVGPQVIGVVLNQILLDQAGGDTDEFVEFKGEANTDYSDISLLQVDGDNSDGTNAGLVLTVHAGCTTDASGYCEININANHFQNGTQSLLLVPDAGNSILVPEAIWAFGRFRLHEQRTGPESTQHPSTRAAQVKAAGASISCIAHLWCLDMADHRG
ncbi:MAG: hypothetical protein GY811_12365 [Myxococcales bacterium]|nr:hypothetical protein [Myxococcales bacterium]